MLILRLSQPSIAGIGVGDYVQRYCSGETKKNLEFKGKHGVGINKKTVSGLLQASSKT